MNGLQPSVSHRVVCFDPRVQLELFVDEVHFAFLVGSPHNEWHRLREKLSLCCTACNFLLGAFQLGQIKHGSYHAVWSLVFILHDVTAIQNMRITTVGLLKAILLCPLLSPRIDGTADVCPDSSSVFGMDHLKPCITRPLCGLLMTELNVEGLAEPDLVVSQIPIPDRIVGRT